MKSIKAKHIVSEKEHFFYPTELSILKNRIMTFKKDKTNTSILPHEIGNEILNTLSQFESNQEYLQPNTTLHILSKKCRTNSKYLSKVINQHKGKNFTQYINDLRIDYVIETLEEDPKFANYTIKAIANEVGFNTATAFSKAFVKKTGKLPSEYIKQLVATS